MPTLSDIHISSATWTSIGLLLLGFVALAIAAKAISGPRILRVPDGVPPDDYYRQWRDSRLSRRLGRAWLFIVFFGVAMLLGGCGSMLIRSLL